jgi:hypothetical protein
MLPSLNPAIQHKEKLTKEEIKQKIINKKCGLPCKLGEKCCIHPAINGDESIAICVPKDHECTFPAQEISA